MFVIKYTVGDYKGNWCDAGIRGNMEPMRFHDKGYADQQCDELNCQYNNEGYSFSVENEV